MNERCFAIRRGGTCNALTVNRCPNYASCPFYKPGWKAERDTARTNKRLCALPESAQLRIAKAYHNGRMPRRSEIS